MLPLTDTLQVAQGLSEWLQAEIKTSDSPNSRNQYLSNHEEVVERWRKDLGEGVDAYKEKKLAHASRFLPDNSSFLSAFMREPKDLHAFANLFFAGLMKLSGENRERAALMSTDQTTYLEQRISSNIVTVKKVRDLFPDLELTPDDIKTSAQQKIIMPILSLTNLDIERGYNGHSFTGETMAPQDKMATLRQGVLGFCIDLVAYGEQTFNTFSLVPALEPFSISDNPQVIYPFNVSMWESYRPSNPIYRQITDQQ